jgi:ATP-dependent Lhr-like helicase
MRRLLESSESLPFLDEVAQRFLAEGRKQYADRALSTEFVLNQGRELMLLTWLGDSANEAIAALLIRRGFVANPAGPGVEVRLDGRTAEDVLDALSDAAVDEPPPLDMLLQDVSNHQREKWDWALPDELLRKAYASLNLDLDEGLSWARVATAQWVSHFLAAPCRS